MKKWIKFTRDSFSTDEDWETLCEEVGCSTDVIYIQINFTDDDVIWENQQPTKCGQSKALQSITLTKGGCHNGKNI